MLFNGKLKQRIYRDTGSIFSLEQQGEQQGNTFLVF
jgi:hypothetical protein